MFNGAPTEKDFDMTRRTTTEVITALGGPTRLAAKLTARGWPVTKATVCRWHRPKASGGTGGYIPAWWAPRVLLVAQDDGEDITAADVISPEEAA
jgi:hypothetical protein